MAKINYEKVERLLLQGLDKMALDDLQDLADELMKEREANVKIKVKDKPPGGEVIRTLVERLRKSLKEVKAENIAFYKRLEKPKERLKELYKKADSVTLDEWEEIKEIKELVMETHRMLSSGGDAQYNQKMISERLRALEKKGKYNFRGKDSWDTV